jgi:monoamine oxidase
LMAARELLRKGKYVTILEAADRVGGRIHTLESEKDSVLEAGAEFVHGELPLTLQLLKEYNIMRSKTGGTMVRVEAGSQKKESGFFSHWDLLLRKMGEVKGDLPFGRFLEIHFSNPENRELKQMAIRFAEGFDIADIDKASTLGLYKEWTKEEGEQYRIRDGYSKLTLALAGECLERGCQLITSDPVKKIVWERNAVHVYSVSGKEFLGEKAILTPSVAILGANGSDPSGIEMIPDLPQQRAAAAKLGYGSVIKILLLFKEPFWNQKLKKTGFIITDEIIPTWWTQYPEKNGLLTGWLGGPKAFELKQKTDEMILLVAQLSLASVFGFEYSRIHALLKKGMVFNWGKNPFALGAYSYPTPETEEARKFLNCPVDHTIFYAGEALYKGTIQGTVEAALVSGLETANMIDESPISLAIL